MKLTKKLISLALAAAMTMGLMLPVFASEADQTIQIGDNQIEKEYELNKNEERSNIIAPQGESLYGTYSINAAQSFAGFNSVGLRIKDFSGGNMNATVTLVSGSNTYQVDVTGENIEVIEGYGYYSVAEGYFDVAANDALAQLVPDGPTNVIANISYTTSGDIYCTLTVGVADESHDPIIAAYGCYSDGIKRINMARYEDNQAESDAINESANQSYQNAVTRGATDTSIVYQGSGNINISTYAAGNVYAYSNLQINNGGTLSVYEKVRTNATGALNYVRAKLNPNATVCVATRANTQISASAQTNTSAVKRLANAHEPTASSKTVDLQVPVFTSVGLPVAWIPISYTVNTVTINTGSNYVKWEINGQPYFKNASGDQSSSDGIWCVANFLYNGNLTSGKTDTISAAVTGSLQYRYTIYETESVDYAYFTTGTATARGTTTVYSTAS